MSDYTFCEDDWPLKDKNGRTIHYKPNTTSALLERGILHFASKGQPRLPWFALKQQLFVTNTLLNFVGYHVPKEIDTRKIDNVRASLQTAFQLAFPGKDAPSVNIFNDEYEEQQRCYVNFDASSKNVASDKIVAAAFLYDWTADGLSLGKPWYVGTPTREALLPVQFADVPDARRERFLQALPEYLRSKLYSLHAVEALDICELQSRQSTGGDWKFDGKVLALVRIDNPTTSINNELGHVANVFPGWFNFEDEHLIKLEYPGRFEYCKYCTHTSHDLATRHEDEACPKVYCGLCKESCPNCVSDSDEEDCEETNAASDRQKKARETAAALELAWEKTIAKDLARRKAAAEEKAKEEHETSEGADKSALSSTTGPPAAGDTASADKSNSGTDEETVNREYPRGDDEAASNATDTRNLDLD